VQELEVRLVPVEEKTAEIMANAARADILASLERQEVDRNALPPRQRLALDENLNAISSQRTLARIEQNPGQYYGAYLDDELHAVARLNAWNTYDQAPYEGFVVGTALKGLAKLRGDHLATRSFGIHTLLTVDESHTDYRKKDGLDRLLQKAVRLAESPVPGSDDGRVYSDLRIGIPEGDLLETSGLLWAHGFAPTDRYADGVAHVPVLKQELYIRKNKS